MIVVIIGVSGAGKTTIGKALAEKLSVRFIDADDLHSDRNRSMMMQGIPLTDEDRGPWLRAIRHTIDELVRASNAAVIACSALKEAYRMTLRREGVHFVYLKASRETIATRLRQRSEHFFDPSLLQSQFDTLEEPTDALVVAAAQPVHVIVGQILDALKGLDSR